MDTNPFNIEPIFYPITIKTPTGVEDVLINIVELPHCQLIAPTWKEPVLTIISDFRDKNKELLHCEQQVVEFDGNKNLREIPHVLISIRAEYPEILEAEEQSYIEFQRVLPELMAIMDDVNRVNKVISTWIGEEDNRVRER